MKLLIAILLMPLPIVCGYRLMGRLDRFLNRVRR